MQYEEVGNVIGERHKGVHRTSKSTKLDVLTDGKSIKCLTTLGVILTYAKAR